MSLQLAKPCLDVGLFTNKLDGMRAFYGDHLGLPFEEILPVGGGVRQHRYGLNGSVLKINHARHDLQDAPTAYRGLVVASRSAAPGPADPDGLPVDCRPPGQDFDQICVRIGATSLDETRRFWTEAVGGQDLAGRWPVATEPAGDDGAVVRIGRTLVEITHDPAAPEVPPTSMRARGFRYTTVQVTDLEAALAHLREWGAAPTPPRRMGDVAAIAFVTDPSGNWIEISQRASLVGRLPDIS